MKLTEENKEKIKFGMGLFIVLAIMITLMSLAVKLWNGIGAEYREKYEDNKHNCNYLIITVDSRNCVKSYNINRDTGIVSVIDMYGNEWIAPLNNIVKIAPTKKSK